jgi:murein DD-endopeptidase MepM/ murein hydrolase activator NlpD
MRTGGVYSIRMIFSPLPGTPTITQGFGQNPEIYSQFGFLGHNGIDFGCPVGTTIYAPHDGVVTLKDDGDKGYGLYVVIDGPTRRSLLAHLSETHLVGGQNISQGDPAGKSGQSGFSTAPHLHWTFKLMDGKKVLNKDNGYEGAIDVTELTRLWQDQNLRQHAEYTDFAKEYLAMTFEPNQYLKNPALG